MSERRAEGEGDGSGSRERQPRRGEGSLDRVMSVADVATPPVIGCAAILAIWALL